MMKVRKEITLDIGRSTAPLLSMFRDKLFRDSLGTLSTLMANNNQHTINNFEYKLNELLQEAFVLGRDCSDTSKTTDSNSTNTQTG